MRRFLRRSIFRVGGCLPPLRGLGRAFTPESILGQKKGLACVGYDLGHLLPEAVVGGGVEVDAVDGADGDVLARVEEGEAA